MIVFFSRSGLEKRLNAAPTRTARRIEHARHLTVIGLAILAFLACARLFWSLGPTAPSPMNIGLMIISIPLSGMAVWLAFRRGKLRA